MGKSHSGAGIVILGVMGLFAGLAATSVNSGSASSAERGGGVEQGPPPPTHQHTPKPQPGSGDGFSATVSPHGEACNVEITKTQVLATEGPIRVASRIQADASVENHILIVNPESFEAIGGVMLFATERVRVCD